MLSLLLFNIVSPHKRNLILMFSLILSLKGRPKKKIFHEKKEEMFSCSLMRCLRGTKLKLTPKALLPNPSFQGAHRGTTSQRHCATRRRCSLYDHHENNCRSICQYPHPYPDDNFLAAASSKCPSRNSYMKGTCHAVFDNHSSKKIGDHAQRTACQGAPSDSTSCSSHSPRTVSRSDLGLCCYVDGCPPCQGVERTPWGCSASSIRGYVETHWAQPPSRPTPRHTGDPPSAGHGESLRTLSTTARSYVQTPSSRAQV